MVPTAYTGEAASKYDELRFSTAHGRLFAELETEQLKRVMKSVPKNSHILEVGCGTGRFVRLLAAHGYRIIATDPSADMLKIASKKCSGLHAVSFRQEEGANLSSADCSFDFVYAIRVINQTGGNEYSLQMMREMIRVAKNRGLILIEFVNAKRFCAGSSQKVKLSFRDVEKLAVECRCEIIAHRGILVFSQRILNHIPAALLPIWGLVERFSATILWRWASRGYTVLRKR